MIIRTENISRQFRSGQEIVHALRNINIEIQSGALTILRGRSGSGKTTLINLMGALDQPSTGHIFFDGQDITRLSEVKKDQLRQNHIDFIFQSIALMPLMTAYENVEFGLRVAGYNPKDRKKRAEECLAMVGLQKRMNHRPQELSGGEQQRVAIARAVAHQPKVVFADEPTAELDTSMGLQVVKLLKDLVEEEGLTVVMTTHDPSMIDIADYVYTLDDGMVIDLAE